MEKELLKKGDKVVMHTCLEAETHNGKIWTCAGDEFTKGKGVYAENVIFLQGFSGYFCTEFLQKVNVEEKKAKGVIEFEIGQSTLKIKGQEDGIDISYVCIDDIASRFVSIDELMKMLGFTK